MNTDAIESMVRDVLSRMNSLQGESPAAAPAAGGTSRSARVSDYPLANKHPEWVKTATNKTLDDFTLENVLSNKVTAQDMRITPETLRLQASIAKDAGRDRLAMNFERAAELTAVPDDRIPLSLDERGAAGDRRRSRKPLSGEDLRRFRSRSGHAVRRA